MKPSVTVVDYGVGNLLSVTRALEHCCAEVRMADTPAGIEAAERLVLPGVGAFADGMAGLRQRSMIHALGAFAESGRPFLGICLGMQMMMETSEEFGRHEGLGFIEGSVIPVPATKDDGSAHKIPHIGWNALLEPVPGCWAGSILGDLKKGSAVYFVHSFMAAPAQSSEILAKCRYDGVDITAAVQSGNLVGCQFHPEKSGEIGLRILRKFLTLGPSNAKLRKRSAVR